MKRRLSALEHLGLAAVLAAWTSLSWASARLTAVEFPQGGENPSQIVLKVAGDAPEITALSFPEARQGVIVIHKAELGMDTTSWNPRGTWLKSMALRKVDSGAEGQGGVQVTMDLAPGVEFQSHVQKGEVVITFKDAQSAPNAAAVQPAEKDKALDLSNKDLEGLAPAQSSSVNPGETQGGQDAKAAAFSAGAYRPEIAPKKNVLTEEEKEELLNQQIFQQRVNLDFKDAELQNVIRLLAARTNLNIILTRGTGQRNHYTQTHKRPIGRCARRHSENQQSGLSGRAGRNRPHCPPLASPH